MIPHESWREDAACRNTDQAIFFARREVASVTYSAAKRVCATCPVKAECLEWAINAREVYFGCFGGLAPRERRLLLRRQQAAARAAARGTRRLEAS